MATTGKQAWAKYFRGQNVPTNMKKNSIGYDPSNPSKILTQKIAAGEEVIAISSDYNTKYPILRVKDNKQYLVTFTNLQKPGAKTRVNLKPQAFGIVDKDYTLDNYVNVLLNNISDGDLAPFIKTYLEALVLYYMRKKPLSYVTSVYSPNLPINDIKKDFGEILGPIAIIKDKILQSKQIRISASSKIFFPSRPNEPLLDYIIKTPTKAYSISAKSGTTTNVVKPGDIIDLLIKDPKKLAKWQNTPQYAVLSQLKEGTVVSGPILAAANLPGGPPLAAAQDIANRMRSGYKDDAFDYNAMLPFLQSNSYLNGKGEQVTLNEIMYESEKMISADSKNNTPYNKIFQDAIENKIIYVKFDINGRTPKFSSLVAEDFKYNKISLRTKNGYTRKSDKMGVQT
jgi:hypothetical protein